MSKGKENRKETRFEEIGRVTCEEICALPGVLDDISVIGCKVHFPSTVEVDKENDYNLCLRLTRSGSPLEFNIKAIPQWVKEENGLTFIGFKILTSPDTPKLISCINEIKDKNDSDVDLDDLIIDSSIDYI